MKKFRNNYLQKLCLVVMILFALQIFSMTAFAAELNIDNQTGSENQPVSTIVAATTASEQAGSTNGAISSETSSNITEPTTSNGSGNSGNNSDTNINEPPKPAFLLINNKKDIPEYKVGDEKIKLSVSLLNWGLTQAEQVTVTPVMKNEAENIEFPFVIEKGDYSQGYENIQIASPGSTNNAVTKEFGPFKVRKDLKNGYYRVQFDINYYDSAIGWQTVQRYTHVKILNPNDNTPIGPKPGDDGIIGGGDIGGGGGIGDDGKKSMPRLIVAGFKTDPAKVFGGDSFKLTLLMRNTSKQTALSNIKLVLTGAAEGEKGTVTFLPVTGASTIFVENIPKDSIQEVSVDMQCSSTLPQKAYPINIQMAYEDSSATNFEATEIISVKVYQETRCDFGKVETMPNPATVGNDVNIMFPIYNKGKSTLYNVTIGIVDDGKLAPEEVYLGNLDSGASKDVDLLANALAENMGEPIKLKVQFEDEEGSKEEFIKEIELDIIARGPESEMPFPGDMGMGMGEDMGMETSGGFPWWGWLLIVVAVVTIGSIVAIKIKKKRQAKKDQQAIDEII